MAEDAELIGGISVSIGASHSKLVSDLAEADRIIESWAKQPRNVTVGATVAGGASGGGGAAGGTGSTSALEAKLDRLTAAMGRGGARDVRTQQVEAESMTINGVKIGRLSQQPAALQSAISKQIGPVEVPVSVETEEIDQVSTKVKDLQVSSKQPIQINMDTKALQNDLQAILALLKQVVAAAAEVSETGVGGGGGGAKRSRRKNIRDRGVGTEAASNRIYTFEPGDETESGRTPQAEAAAARQRELAFTTHQQRAQATEAAAQRRAEQAALRADAQARRQAEAAAATNERAAAAATGATPGTPSIITRLMRATDERPVAYPPVHTTDVPGSSLTAPAATPESRAADAARRRLTPVTDADRARFEAESLAQAARDDQAARPQTPARRTLTPGERIDARQEAERQRFQVAATKAGRTRQFQEAEIVRRQEQAEATQEAAITAAGRTARTTASGLGAFFGGPRREQIEAQAALTAAQKETGSATRYRNVFENELIRNTVKAQGATERESKALHARNQEIRGSDEYKQSILDQTKAIEGEAKATERVQKLSQGFGTAAQSLLSVTVAGSAFGIGLQAVSVGFAAAEKAASPYIDAITGYAQKTNDFTAALADQARQQQGNAQGVTALKLAQSGFAASAAASIQPVIAQRVQVEAGNKALQEQIDTFRVAEALRKQSATAGLGGGTGGVLGTSLFGIPGTGEQTGNFLQGLGQEVGNRKSALAATTNAPFANNEDPIGHFLGLNKSTPQSRAAGGQADIAQAQQAFTRGLSLINAQLDQGGDGAAKFQQALTPLDSRINQTASAFDSLSPEMAKAIRDNNLYSDAIAGSSDSIGSAISALKALNLAGTLTGPGEQLAAQKLAQKNSANSVAAIQSQQEFQRPGFFASLIRQQGVQSQVQLPAQEALANLANPPTPVGTGIRGRADEQGRINASLKETQTLQDQLNGYYEQGQQVLEDTYKPAVIQTFGQAAGQVFGQLLTDITTTGQAIAKVQSTISNESAAYAVHQYNMQLFIAKRTLSDIGGLTAHNFGAGQSELGVLERQNLLLGRQAQLLQFSLSQRQINFNKAVAGFTVPGLTPAEQNARVSEAKTEADFAQKQLNIQRQMFGNQVKIVDITNLRQGADLVKQIGLLTEGRKVTIDTQLAEQRLDRLNKKQAHLTAQAGTFITAVDSEIAKAESDMAQVEAAAGHALERIAVQGVAAAYNVGHAFFVGASGGFLSSGTGNTGPGGPKSGHGPHRANASGGIFNTQGTTNLGAVGIAGEAGRETVAILRNPHALSGMGGGGGATINFNGDMVFKTEADFQRLYRMVVTAMGKDAANKGLRTPF